MNPILAENVLLQFFKDGDYRDFACLTDCSIETTTEVKDVRTIGNGVWKKKRGQSLAYVINCSGIIELEELQPVSFWVLDFQHQMLHVQWRLLFEQPETGLIKILTGEALIENSVLAAAATGFATSDFRMQGHGAYTVADSATVCDATIDGLSIGDGNPELAPGSVASFTWTETNSFTARVEYSVDGGARQVVFIDPESEISPIWLYDLAEGVHTLEVWAVCETGVDGEYNSLTFEIEEGGGVPSCALPGVPSMSDIEPTTATASWTAASPAPVDYFWELVLVSTSTVVDSGNTTGLSVDLEDLTPEADYIFRVKSRCEIGVSESAFQSIEFTAGEEPETCTPPGNVGLISTTSTTASAPFILASPAPPFGYSWYVLKVIDSTIVAGGTSAGSPVAITGLEPATDYIFNVRSICQPGVNYSIYKSRGFTTDA